jgi:hypothetical protein
MTLLCEDLSELYSHFNEYRLTEQCCDVIIKVGEQSFPCHRIILASTEYFRNMFSGKFAEAKKDEIILKGIDADDFELLLTHIYGSRITVKDDNVYRLLRISHYMGPQSLENLCVNYVVGSNSLPLDTVLNIFMFACETKKTVLVDRLTAFVAQNFLVVSKRAKFFRIPGKELLQILSSSDLDRDPSVILDFLACWVKSETDEGKKLLPSMLAAVNLSEVPIDWFLRVLVGGTKAETSSTVSDDDEDCEEAGSCNENEDSAAEVSVYVNLGDAEDRYLRQKGEQLPFIVFTLDTRSDEEDSNDILPTINTYQLMVGKDDHYTQFLKTEIIDIVKNFERVHCKSVFVDELRFSIVCVDVPATAMDSGSSTYSSRTRTCNTVIQYKPKDYYFWVFLDCGSGKLLKTHRLPGIEKTLENISVVANGTDIYLYNDAEFVMFNTQRNEWVTMPVVDCVRTLSPNLLSLENNLYLVGGKYPTSADTDEIPMIRAQTDGKLFQRYDTREGKWSQMPKMKYARYRSASCIHNNTLYVSGGDDLVYYKGYIECFDLKAGKWHSFITSMPESKMNHTLLAYNDQLWFFGGQNHHCSKKEVNDLSWYLYDLKQDTWSSAFNMPSTYGKFTTKEILDVVLNI